MKKRVVVLLTLSLVLAGCASLAPEPRVFGVRQSQWHMLTPGQKSQVIAAYNERTAQHVSNEPWQQVPGNPDGLVHGGQHWHAHAHPYAKPPQPVSPSWKPHHHPPDWGAMTSPRELVNPAIEPAAGE